MDNLSSNSVIYQNNHADYFLEQSRPDSEFSLSDWFKRLTGNSTALRLGHIVKNLACHVGLSKKQHLRLNRLAFRLQNALQKSHFSLDEEQLVAVLRGDDSANETLATRFGIQGNHLIKERVSLLAALKSWYQSLSVTQQQIIASMQQRSFRLSMG